MSTSRRSARPSAPARRRRHRGLAWTAAAATSGHGQCAGSSDGLLRLVARHGLTLYPPPERRHAGRLRPDLAALLPSSSGRTVTAADPGREDAMKLEGIHHITCITADARGNVDFYARLLGLRMVKKTVNQDEPSVYHLFYADEQGSPGADLTFFEFPGVPAGRAGDGMVHRIVSRVGSVDALAFWEDRLGGEGHETVRDGERLRFRDPEGLEHELAVIQTPDEALIARAPDVPAQFALQGFDSVRAYSSDPERSRPLLETAFAFEPRDGGWEARGE